MISMESTGQVSDETYPVWDHSNRMHLDFSQVEVELGQLRRALILQVDLLQNTIDSLLVLEQSVSEPVSPGE